MSCRVQVKMKQNQIDISITKDEAVVLFEILSRFSDKDKLNIEHKSEEKVLWDLHCILEKILSEPFAYNYKEVLEKARNNIVK